jgi:hypothetical protein
MSFWLLKSATNSTATLSPSTLILSVFLPLALSVSLSLLVLDYFLDFSSLHFSVSPPPTAARQHPAAEADSRGEQKVEAGGLLNENSEQWEPIQTEGSCRQSQSDVALVVVAFAFEFAASLDVNTTRRNTREALKVAVKISADCGFFHLL